ncbi:MAG TPA: alkaline phosphatase family protein [Tepidisphaeraceae bacterium]|nr:alkaline phosphatase family protein [Tepidisphaeraceae bacterium]
MTPDLQRLFEQGLLVRPTHEQPNVVHLVRALATLTGVSEIESPPATRGIADVIGAADHLIFVLCDGLGMNTLARLPQQSSFLARHYKMTLNATCPSTTACALTSIATASYPNQHGVTGWFTHLPELEITILPLPFVERFSKQWLTERGLRPEDLFPLRAIEARMSHQPITLLPAPIMDTSFARYSRGHTRGLGYRSIPHAIDKIIAHINGAKGPTYTHLYLPDIDTVCHHLGVEHPNVVNVVMRIDAELDRLSAALGERARVVVSADHGLIDVLTSDQAFLTDADPMLAMLRVPPTGDARMPIFHVKPDLREQFVDLFGERYGDRMILLETGEAERLELFGPGKMAQRVRPRFGDFIAIPYRRATLAYGPVSVPGAAPAAPYIGQHAGLSPEEMRVPLCVA